MQHFVQTQQQDWGMGCMNGKGMGAMQNLREMLCTESTARVRWLEWRWEELVGGVLEGREVKMLLAWKRLLLFHLLRRPVLYLMLRKMFQMFRLWRGR